jgi:hypothetical protein
MRLLSPGQASQAGLLVVQFVSSCLIEMKRSLNCARCVVLALTILANANITAVATTRIFQQHNFAIEVPSNWHELNPPSPQVLAVVQSPDRSKTIIIFAQKFPDHELGTAVRGMMEGSRQSAIEKGWQVIDEGATSINGVPFNVALTRVRTNSSIINFFGVAGNEGYVLSGTHNAGNAESDDELLSSIKSFRLLAPRSIPPQSKPVSDAYRMGYRVGHIFGILLVPALIGVGVVCVILHFTRKKR